VGTRAGLDAVVKHVVKGHEITVGFRFWSFSLKFVFLSVNSRRESLNMPQTPAFDLVIPSSFAILTVVTSSHTLQQSVEHRT